MNTIGALYALASAALFGASTPAAKLLVGTIDPFLLAGLLYCGAGIGVAVLRRAAPIITSESAPAQVALNAKDVPWLAGAIAAGGIAGPLLLMWGLTRATASAASLLLSLEGVATAVIAWFVFHENFDRRILFGFFCLMAGAAILSWSGTPTAQALSGPLAIVGACLAWGIDNNLTRKVSLADPLQIVELKGLIAGPFNVALGLWAGATLAPSPMWLVAGVIGFIGYGISLALYVLALRHLGAARTGAYFSTAPFVGAVVSIVLLGDHVTLGLIAAGALMGLGVWLHLSEHHEHAHTHEAMTHGHPHVHDEHHRHTHGPDDPPGEPHTHVHRHEPLVHAHAHTPDMHHLHRHRSLDS
jgi:drug/metabolite transporter (DMT)-like permease